MRVRFGLIVPALVILALACSQSGAQDSDPPAVSELKAPRPSPAAAARPEAQTALRTPKGPPPKVDTSIAGVPIEDVVFDTFMGGFLRLSEASDADIEALRDRIKPIYVPRYDPLEIGDWMKDNHLVIGYVAESGAAFAYPLKILNFHEIVNDVIDGLPVLVSYCPLCASGAVYSRELDGQVLLFGNTSALYQSDLVMYDHQTGSYWFQVIGEAIVGPLTGSWLQLLPSQTTTWGRWKELHPKTKVLSRDLGLVSDHPVFGSPYDRAPFVGYEERVNDRKFAFPVTEEKLDDRLRPADRVIALQVGDSHKAYLLTGRPDEVINDEVGGEKVVVIVRADRSQAPTHLRGLYEGPSGSAYMSALDGRELTFSIIQGEMADAETGSRWDDGGRAVSGPLAGARLMPVPSRTSFWFSLVGSLPGVELYQPGE